MTVSQIAPSSLYSALLSATSHRRTQYAVEPINNQGNLCRVLTAVLDCVIVNCVNLYTPEGSGTQLSEQSKLIVTLVQFCYRN